MIWTKKMWRQEKKLHRDPSNNIIDHIEIEEENEYSRIYEEDENHFMHEKNK